MIEIATWLSVIILGPGSIAVFLWFLAGVRQVFSPPDSREREE